MKLTEADEIKIVKSFLATFEISEKDTDIIADVICSADMTGVHSHGLSRFIRYIKQFESGALNAKPDIKQLSDFGASMLYECDNASGLVAVNLLYDKALPRARQYGVSVCGGANSANLGCGYYYGRRAAADGMIMLLMSNTYPCMAPFGGRELMMGTNPIIMAAPGKSDIPIVLDMSTSNVAMGRITSFFREGKTLPDGWANDAEGKPTNDPGKAYAVTPIAGHKGYGLSMFVDIISALLTSSQFLNRIPPVEELKPESTGIMMILIDIEKFMPREQYNAAIAEYTDMIKNSSKAEGVKEIFMPGEIEHRKNLAAEENGFEVSDAVLEELRLMAVERGLLNSGDSIEKLFY